MDDLAHIVRTQDWLIGYYFKLPVRSLCGFEFVPFVQSIDTPVCAECIAQMQRLQAAQLGLN